MVTITASSIICLVWYACEYDLTCCFAVEPYLLYMRYNTLIQRQDILGGGLTTLYNGGVPRALAFDYRYVHIVIQKIFIVM